MLKDSAFVHKQVYILDKVAKEYRTYVKGDSTLLVESGCAIQVLSNVAYIKYRHKSDSLREVLDLVPLNIIDKKISYNEFINYVQEYLPKARNLRKTSRSELYNCILLSNIIDREIFFGKKKILPLLYDYKSSFDSTFNIQFQNHDYRFTFSKVIDKTLILYARKCKELGYKPYHYSKKDIVLNIVEDIKEFYRSCPLKYKLLVMETEMKLHGVKIYAVSRPLYFFLLQIDEVVSDWY
ncbi:hypothetical protein [Bernardetia sp.]|uniref:hypothetical protein n=1 Tax=Bernardetia sp. TaxID=1937974 RepID=UPI0025BE6618|nr:hypothetical protein [Bernardetia sp.]